MRRRRLLASFAFAFAVPLAGCSATSDETGESGAAASEAALDACHSAPPEGVPMPPPLPGYAGTCPSVDASGWVTLTEGPSRGRRYMVFRPRDERPGEQLPVIFLWHWLSGKTSSMAAAFDVERAVERERFIAIVPESKKTTFKLSGIANLGETWQWPFSILNSDERVDEEARFFEDMLWCIDAQLPRKVARHCVSTVGVSGGALFSAQLLARESQHLASIVSLSGGVGGLVKPLYPAPQRPVPALVLWGGASDKFIVDFQASSKRLEKSLKKSAIIECVHNCGHAIPPFATRSDGLPSLDFVYRFVFDHPYFLPRGKTPWAANPPSDMPDWCAVGAGNAKPRAAEGACPQLERKKSSPDLTETTEPLDVVTAAVSGPETPSTPDENP